MPESIQLSLEQQFSIRSFEAQVRQMSKEQAQDFLVKMYKQMLVKETMYRNLIKSNWGLDTKKVEQSINICPENF